MQATINYTEIRPFRPGHRQPYLCRVMNIPYKPRQTVTRVLVKEQPGLPEDVRRKLHQPIDMALNRFTTGGGSFVDWHNVTFRMLVGLGLSDLCSGNLKPLFRDAVDILNRVHTRNITEFAMNPRMNNWRMLPEEYGPLFDRLQDTIEMHEIVHRLQLIPIYEEVNTVVNAEIALFDANFPLKEGEKHDGQKRPAFEAA